MQNIIRDRRLSLEMEQMDVAKRAGISIGVYTDLEEVDGDVFDSISIAELKRICSILNIDIISLVEHDLLVEDVDIMLSISRCSMRNEIIKNRRKELGISDADFSEIIGFNECVIQIIEDFRNGIDLFPMDTALNISRSLNLPLRLIVGY
jgi:transcriptional regulator with XRE-family HTH domain